MAMHAIPTAYAFIVLCAGVLVTVSRADNKCPIGFIYLNMDLGYQPGCYTCTPSDRSTCLGCFLTSSYCALCEQGYYLDPVYSDCSQSQSCDVSQPGYCPQGYYCDYNGASYGCQSCEFPATGCSSDGEGQQLITACANGFTPSSDGLECICDSPVSPEPSQQETIYSTDYFQICTNLIPYGDYVPPTIQPLLLSCYESIFMSDDVNCQYDAQTNAYSVQYCADGYYVDPNESLCFACEYTMGGCTSCDMLQDYTFECYECGDGYYTVPEPGATDGVVRCLQCPKNCRYCDDATTCTALYEGSPYYIDAAGAVQSCETDSMYWCDHDPDTFALTRVYCRDGYFRLEQAQQCGKMSVSIDACVEYASQNTCLRCQSGYQVTRNRTACVQCGPNAVSCTLLGHANTYDTFPQTCAYGYGSTQTSCIECAKMDANCVACSWVGKEQVGCFQCRVGYYLNSDGVCESCAHRFSKCVACTEDECLQCESGFGTVGVIDLSPRVSGEQPRACENCAVKATPQCQACIVNPNYKTTKMVAWICVACDNGYALDAAHNVCVVCAQKNCAQCALSSDGKGTLCKQCQSGYNLTATGCVANLFEGGYLRFAVLAFALFFALSIYI